jgi:hypothetical protein
MSLDPSHKLAQTGPMSKTFVQFFLMLTLPLFSPSASQAKEIKTNEVMMSNAPDWLTESRVDKVTFRLQQKLEWTTRKIDVKWYPNRVDFDRAHTLGPNAIAVTVGQGTTATVHLGPRVTASNFDEVFGHELVHVIVIQKYKGAIPKWLEEGLANHYSNHGKVNYKWLASKPFPEDVKSLAHPLLGSADGISYRYEASQALAEMLDKKCEMENLVRMSVQRKMEDYIGTLCEIKDLNAAFRAWVKAQAAR